MSNKREHAVAGRRAGTAHVVTRTALALRLLTLPTGRPVLR
ncbi:MAG TPA: hypothetical protein VHX38_29510 [Pseudonocardiaceae bacterium]|jgi:hypothetical protein|nr:hypothetical protein [Pseudonocardiaceae bacterium]